MTIDFGGMGGAIGAGLAQATGLLAAGLLAGRLARRSGPAGQSLIYRATLASVLACPVVAAGLGRAGLGLTLRAPVAVPGPTSTPVEVAASAPAAEVVDPIGPTPAAVPVPPTVPTPVEAGPPSARWTRPDPVAAGLGCWAAGTLALAARLGLGARRLARVRAAAVGAGPAAEAACAEVAARLGVRAPRVLRAPFLAGPCLVGVRDSAILLPEDDPGDPRAAIAHELAHLARRDVAWNGLRHGAVALLWFHPLIWALSRRIEATAEEACDDAVVGLGLDRAGYARLLLDLAGRMVPAPAVGVASTRSALGRRVARILDAGRSPSAGVGSRAGLAVTAAGLAATTLAALLGAGRPAPTAGVEAPQAPPAAAAAAPVASGEIEHSGRVVGPDGRPVPGAAVVAYAWRERSAGPGEADPGPEVREVARVAVDAEGRFAMRLPSPPGVPDWEVAAYAAAPGYGPTPTYAANPYYGPTQADGAAATLVPDDVPVVGRVVDPNGRPVAGATVRVRRLHAPKPGSEVPPDAPPARFRIMESLALDPIARFRLAPAATDADGRFRLDGLGRGRLAEVEVAGPGLGRIRAHVATRRGGHLADPPDASMSAAGFVEPGEFGAACTLVVGPERPVAGVVRDAESGAPIPGALVTIVRLRRPRPPVLPEGEGIGFGAYGEFTVSSPDPARDGFVATRTDAEGRYRLEGCPRAGGLAVGVYPPADRPYFADEPLDVPAGPGDFDIPLRRGAWVTGRVADVRSGRPVAATVEYRPMKDNPAAQGYPNFRFGGEVAAGRNGRRTDAEGRFRVVGIPGRGVVAARADDPGFRRGLGAAGIPEDTIDGRVVQAGQLATLGPIVADAYQALRAVDIPPAAGEVARDLPVDPGGSATFRVVDEAGAPATGAVVSFGAGPRGDSGGSKPLDDRSEVRVGGIEPGVGRVVGFTHRGRKLGAVVTIRPGAPLDGPVQTVVLRPLAAIAGRLVDGRGRPVAGQIQVDIALSGGRPGGMSAIPVGSSPIGPDGRFRVDPLLPGASYRVQAVRPFDEAKPDRGGRLVPVLDGAGPEAGKTLDLGTIDVDSNRTEEGPAPAAPAADPAAGVPIAGRVVDPAGRPVAGVAVGLASVRPARGGSLDAWLGRVRAGQEEAVAARDTLEGPPAVAPPARSATADADGRFRFDGVPAEAVAAVTLRGGGVATRRVTVATRRMEPVAAPGLADRYGPGPVLVFGADFTVTAAPSRPVEGSVVDAESGRPVAGAEVRSDRFAGSRAGGVATLAATADAEGRFRLDGMPAGAGNVVVVVPPADQPYFPQEVAVPEAPAAGAGAGPATVEVRLRRGIWISGRLTEEGTGRPVADARVYYLPFLDNPAARAHPAFRPDGNVAAPTLQDRGRTGPDGSFRVVGLPGRAIVGALDLTDRYVQGAGSEAIAGAGRGGYFPTFRLVTPASTRWPTAMREVNPPEAGEAAPVDLRVSTGASARLRVVDPEGRPLAGVTAEKLAGLMKGGRVALPDSGEAAATHLRPGEERSVLFRHAGRRLARIVRVRAGLDADGPAEVRLEPTSTLAGRVLDAEGRPAAGDKVTAAPLPGGDFSVGLPAVGTDAAGRFVVPDVPTGVDYLVIASRMRADGRYRQARIGPVAARPGAAVDVGDVRYPAD